MADTQGRPYPSGPYTPGDEPPLAFERRRPPRAERPRRGGPPPVTLILSAMLLLGVGGAVAFMYRAGVREPGGAPRPVGTPVGEMRIAAPAQAQPADPAAGLTIYKETPPPASPAFTPAPEQPLPRSQTGVPPAAAASAAPVPTAEASTSAAASKSHVAVSSATSVVGAPQKRASAAEPIAKPPAETKAKPKTIDALLTGSAPAEPDHSALTKHAAKLADAAPQDAKTKAAKPDKPTDKPGTRAVKAAKAEVASTTKDAHSAAVQIGAFSSRALAEAAAAKGSGGHARRIVPVTRADGTILYRASLTGFTSREAAANFCGKLKASGGACFVAR